jgi:LacI family repressor for deo operon, udp, cdd, tsx, nupC, and nupG
VEFVSYANLPLINYIEYIPTASVEQFPDLQGQKATEILLDLLARKQHVTEDQVGFYKSIIESKLVENSKY